MRPVKPALKLMSDHAIEKKLSLSFWRQKTNRLLYAAHCNTVELIGAALYVTHQCYHIYIRLHLSVRPSVTEGQRK